MSSQRVRRRARITTRHRAGALLVVPALLWLATLSAAQAQPTTGPATRPAAPRQWELLSHGSGERFWYAVTTPPSSPVAPHTFIREYKLQEEWQKLSDFSSRLVALGDLRGQLVASLDDGEL